MTLDEAVALSLVPELSRVALGDRLRSHDPELADIASGRLHAARRAREAAEACGIGVLPWNDAQFPAALLTTTDFPPVLWYRGQLDALNAPAVAVVGSRAASAVALETATRLGGDLASLGIAVVSGLARGVDSAAHRGALGQGITIAVLGSGLDVIYPPEHAKLATEIAARGIVITEYPPGTPPKQMHFPLRNRLISGLSLAVVVVEAAERSGSLITAACAAEQGREVMAVPGNVLTGRNRGAHALIRDGAKIVETAVDIVDELGLVSRPVEGAGGGGSCSVAKTCSDPLLQAMRAGQAYDIDGLSDASGLDGPRLLPRLLDLELRGFVRRIGGGRFMRST